MQWWPKRLGVPFRHLPFVGEPGEPGVPWLKRFSDAEKKGNTKQDELKLRVDLRKEGEICLAGCIKDPMTASRDFKGQ